MRLKEIIKSLGNKSYRLIVMRCKWLEDSEWHDAYYGACSYESETETLNPLDYDSYSLDDVYEEWKELDDGSLTVWEKINVEIQKTRRFKQDRK